MKIVNSKNFIQPSAVERNFATEPFYFIPIYEEWKSWDWYNHDWLIEFSYTPVNAGVELPMWCIGGSALPMMFRKSEVGRMSFYSRGFFQRSATDVEAFYLTGTADPLTYKRAIVKIIGNTLTFTQDDIGTRTWENIVRLPDGQYPYPPYFTEGTGNSLKIIDLTLGRVMWDFPSWPEKTRLMTYNNITTQNGFFTLANPSALGGVQTPLDLRGNTTSKTFICKANCHRSPDDGQLHSHALISQGYVWGTVANYCFGFLVRQDYRASARSLSLYYMYSGASAAQGLMAYPLPETVLDNTCVYAGVMDMVKKRCFLYLNGNLLFSTGITGEPWRANPQATAGIPVTRVAIRQEQHTLFLGSTDVYSAFIYEGAMEAEEIAAISKLCQNAEQSAFPSDLGVWSINNPEIAMGEFSEGNQIIGFGGWKA